MTDYSELVKTVNIPELVKALRLIGKEQDCNECEAGRWHHDFECCLFEDAAAAIEELQAEQKKTVTQIFCEEQMAWEGRCKDLMKQISELQAEVKRLELDNEDYEHEHRRLKGEIEALQAEVKILKVSGREAYFEGMAAEAEPKRGKWEREMDVNDEPFYQCSVCGECFDFNRDSTHEVFKYCPDCGAKMEVQE